MFFWCGNSLEDVTKRAESSNLGLIMQGTRTRSFLNTGFYFVRSVEETIQLFDKLVACDEQFSNDQQVFNNIMCDPKYGGSVFYDFNPRRSTVGCAHGNVSAGILPMNLYLTGKEMYAGRPLFQSNRATIMNKCTSKEVMVIHNNVMKGTRRFIALSSKDCGMLIKMAYLADLLLTLLQKVHLGFAVKNIAENKSLNFKSIL